MRTRISRFAGFIGAMRTLLWGRVEKTNKSELWNRLTYRLLIYIFSQMRNLEVKIPIWIFFFEKTSYFFWGWRLNFFLSPCYHTQDICNNFIGSKFSVGCMVWSDANYSKIKSTPKYSYSSIDSVCVPLQPALDF